MVDLKPFHDPVELISSNWITESFSWHQCYPKWNRGSFSMINSFPLSAALQIVISWFICRARFVFRGKPFQNFPTRLDTHEHLQDVSGSNFSTRNLVFIRVSSVKFSSLSTVRWFNDMQPIWSFALCGIRRRTNQYSSKRLLSRHNARSLISNLS